MTDGLAGPSTRILDAVPGSEPEISPADAPERHGKALLGWLPEPEVRPLFQVAAVTSPLDVEDFVNEARARRQARTRILDIPPAQVTLSELPALLESRAGLLRATEQFKTAYEPFGARLVVVPLADL